MATLYRKYRPQNFEEVVGQNHIKLTLEHELQANKIAHAYLFCGPRAVGKTTLARVFAKSLNCQKKAAGQSEPCNTCPACQDITAGKALDVIEIDAASHTGVDNVRDNIIAGARVSPVNLRYKIFVIDEVHMLSGAAFNALLKIMEEPPEFVLFILCTTEVHKIPTTIISRCQRFDFKKISLTDVVKKLEYIVKAEKIKVDRQILESIGRQAGGHMRDAESLLGQVVSLVDPKSKELEITVDEAALVIPRNDLNEVINLIDYLAKKDTAGAIRLINKLVTDGFDLRLFNSNIIEILRQMILLQINPDLIASLGLELGESLEQKLISVNKSLNLAQLLRFIEIFIKAETQLKDSFIIQLPLELAVVELCVETKPLINKTVAPAVAQPIANQTMSKAIIDLEQVRAKWPELLNRIKQNNHSLSFILRSCLLTNVLGNTICLTFKHKFHQDRISEMEIKKLVEQALRDIYGHSLTIKTFLDENVIIENGNGVELDKTENNSNNANNEQNNEAIDNVLKNFGGKIIQ